MLTIKKLVMKKVSHLCCYNLDMIKNIKEQIKERMSLKYVSLLAIFTIVVFSNTVSIGAVEVYVDGTSLGDYYIGSTPSQIKQSIVDVAVANGFDITNLDSIQINTPVDELVLDENNALSLSIEKQVPVEIAGEVHLVSTYVHNVGQLKQEYNLNEVSTNYSDDTLLIDIVKNDQKLVVDTETNVFTKDYTIEYSTTYVDSDTLYVDEEEVDTAGVDGYYEETTTQILLNGEVINETTKETNRVEPTNEVILVGTKEKPTYSAGTTSSPSTSSDWNSVAYCESSGNWGINTGNGYYGGLQINESNWNNYAPGLGITADLPNQASADEQILVAEQILAAQGWGAWGNCAPY